MMADQISEVPSIESEPEEVTRLRALVRLQTAEVIQMGAALRTKLFDAHVAAGMEPMQAAVVCSFLLPLVGESKK